MSTNFYIDKSDLSGWTPRGPENNGNRGDDEFVFIGKRYAAGGGLCAFKWATHPLELTTLPQDLPCIDGEGDSLLTVPQFLEQIVKPCAWEDFDFSFGWG